MAGTCREWRQGVRVKEEERSELQTKERCHDGSNQGSACSDDGEGTDSRDAVGEYEASW